MANQFLIKETMAAMRGLSAAEIAGLQNETYTGVELLGYYQKGDTPAPIMYYNVNSLTDPRSDDGGSVIEVGGIKLVHRFSDIVNVLYFGLICDYKRGTLNYTDNSGALLKLADYMSKFKGGNLSNPPILIFPSGGALGYASTQDIEFSGGYDIKMFAPLIRVGTIVGNGAFLRIGNYSDTERMGNQKRTLLVAALREEEIIWGNQYVGIEIRNYTMSDITVSQVQGFDIGIRLKGHNSAFSYNTIDIGSVFDCRIGIDCTSWSPLNSVNSGYITSCVFKNINRISNGSLTATYDYDRIGINIGYEGGAGYNPESLTFYGGVIEKLIDINTPVNRVGIPINIKQGDYNTFNDFRHEYNARNSYKYFMDVERGQANRAYLTAVTNIVGGGDWDYSNLCKDQNGKNNVYYLRYERSLEGLNYNNHIYSVNNFQDIFNKYDATSAYMIGWREVNFNGIENEFLRMGGSQEWRIINNSLNIPSGRQFFMDLDTSSCKNFCINTVQDSSNFVGFYFIMYDNEGQEIAYRRNDFNIIGTLKESEYNFSLNNVAMCSDYYPYTSNDIRPLRVSEKVKKVRIIIRSQNNKTNLKSVTILSLDGRLSNGNTTIGSKVGLAISMPNSGYYKKGTFLLAKDVQSPTLNILGYMALENGEANTISWHTILKNGPDASTSTKGLLNQAVACDDMASIPGPIYSQSDANATLTELRDLKEKLRTAGILAT